MSFVKINEVTKQFQNNTVLNKISLALEKGEFATLLGQSGCGKSTLMRTIAGLIEIDSGTISIDGSDITNVEPRKRQIGMVFQSYALFPNMTVFDNIAFGLKMKKQKHISKKVHQMIEMVNLTGKDKAYPHQLSGGQQQRVALARSLVMEPKVLLLDEPLSALDAKIRKNLQKELVRIQKEMNITTVFVTHDQEEAMTMSDTIYVMNEGNIEQSGSPSDIYTAPANSFVAQFIGNYNVIEMNTFHHIVENNELTGKEIAIRPEVIQLVSVHKVKPVPANQWGVKGTIKDIAMIGNVLRYDVEVNGTTILVDDLHHSGKAYEIGTKVSMRVPKKECIVF